MISFGSVWRNPCESAHKRGLLSADHTGPIWSPGEEGYFNLSERAFSIGDWGFMVVRLEGAREVRHRFEPASIGYFGDRRFLCALGSQQPRRVRKPGRHDVP